MVAESKDSSSEGRIRGLFKRKDSPFWWICYSTPRGTVKESTRQCSKRIALEYLSKKRIEASDERFLGYKPTCEFTFAEICKRFLDWSKTEKTPRSYERDISLVANLCEVFGNRPAVDVTRADLDQYRMMRTKVVSGASINREMSCCRRIYNLAIRWQLLEHNPASHISMYPETRRMRFLRVEEQRRLLAACRESRQPLLYPIVALAMLSGCRRGELLSLEWRHVDLSSGTLTIENTKSHVARTVPLCAQAVQVLRELPSGNKSDKLFPVGSVKTGFKTALARADLKGFTFHDLRHTAASTMVNEGVDLLTVQRILGHESLAMTLRYSHLTDRKLRQAVNQIPDILSQEVEDREGSETLCASKSSR